MSINCRNFTFKNMLRCNCYFATLYFPIGKNRTNEKIILLDSPNMDKVIFFVIENETVIGIKERIQVANSMITFKVVVYILSLQL